MKNKITRLNIVGIDVKSIKPLSFLLKPSLLAVPLVGTSLVAQLGTLAKLNRSQGKKLQMLDSNKYYSKILGGSNTSKMLSNIYALAKTFSFEADLLANLSTEEERKSLLEKTLEELTNSRGTSKIIAGNSWLTNKDSCLTHRRGLALRVRSTMQSDPIFKPNNISIGIPLKDINMENIKNSSTQI